MTRAATENGQLLAPIEAKLRRLIWRARAAIALRGALATLAAASLAMLVTVVIAVRWPFFEAWQQYALTCLWVGAGLGAAFVMLVRPLARSFSLAGIARVVEQHHPELHERISSTVELLHSSDAPEIRGSEALIHALATEAGQDARSVRPRREVTFRRARPFLIALAAVGAVIVVLCATSRGMRNEFAKRLLPFLNLPNFHAGDLIISPGVDRTVLAGERLEVTVSLTKGKAAKARWAEVHVARPEGGHQVVRMNLLPGPVGGIEGGGARPEKTFAYTTPPLQKSMRYRVRVGDARSRYYQATVEPRPAAAGIEVAYDYPDYLGREDLPPTPGTGRLEAPVGTVATVRVRLNKPVAAAELFVNDGPAELTRLGESEYSFVQALSRPSAGSWRLVLTDAHGYTGEAGGQIAAIADAAPAARIVSPVEDKLKLKPADRLPIGYTVYDEIGLDRAELVVAIDGGAERAMPVPMRKAATGPAAHPGELETVLNLTELELSSARKITFQLRAWDNRPDALGGAQEGVSAQKTIELDVKAPGYVFQVQMALDLRVRQTLERIYQELTEAKKLSEPLRRSMPATKKLTDKTVAKIKQMRQHLVTAEQDTRALAEVTAGSAYPTLSQTLSKLADANIAKAVDSSELIVVTDNQKARAEQADEADFQIDRALAIVSDLLKKFDVLTELARRAIALQELAERQEALAAAKLAEATTQPATAPAGGDDSAGAMSGEEWERAQEQVARDTGQLVRQTPNALHESLGRNQQRSRDLAEMAERLQRRQQALLQHTAAAEAVRQTQQQLRQLAAEQATLAGQIGQLAQQARPVPPSVEPTTQAAHQAQAAAGALTTTQPATALPMQTAAEQALAQTAQQAQAELQRHAAAELAAAAERMADQQAQLAQRSESAAPHQQTAQAAQQAAAQATARQRQVLAQVGGRLAGLARRQAALAQRAGQLEQPTSPPAPARPAQAMQQAATSLRQGDPASAAAQAARAGGQSQQLAGELARRAAAAPQAAQQAEQRAQQAAAQAQQAAQRAQKAAQAAAQAQQQSAAAAQRAQQAQATTQQTGAAAAQQAAAQAQQAAQRAQQAAQAAQKQSQQAQQASQAAAQAAQQARGQVQPAQQHSAAAGKLAQEQAQLAREIAAAAAREAPQAAQAQAAGQQAAAQQAQAAKQTRQAAQQLQGAPQAQQQLAKQVPQLKRLAAKADRQVQTAMRQHDPTAGMQRAAAELSRSRAARAAPSQRTAEQQLHRIAEAAREQLARTDPQRAAQQLAAAAERMARRQEQLAGESGEAVRQQQAGQAAQRTSEQQQQRQRQIVGQIAGRQAPLAGRQEALAKQAGQLEQAAAASQQARPARAMQQAAEQLRKASPQAAAPHAQQAAQQAERMAGELAQRSAAAEKASQGAAERSKAQPADQAAAQTARQAMARAQQASRQADAARQLARRQAELARQAAQAAAAEAPHAAQAQQAQQQAAADAAQAAHAGQQAARQAQATAGRQRQLTDQVGQLSRLAQQATPAAQAAMRQHNPTANMQRAAGELAQSRPAQAQPAQQAAARQLRQIAQAARQQVDPTRPTEATQIARSAASLAQQQQRLRARAAELTGQLARGQNQLDRQELTRLQAAQQQIAREAAELSDDVRQQAPQADRIDTQAARAAAEALRRLGGRQLAAAAESGHRAANLMNEMERRLGRPEEGGGEESGQRGEESGQGGEESGHAGQESGHGGQESGHGGQESGHGGQDSGQGSGQPGQGRSGQVQAATPSGQEPDQVAAEQGPTAAERRAELAEQAGDLAGRQQRVADEAAALAGRRRGQLLASRQQQIGEGTADLQQGAELINDHIRDLLPDATARQLARQATGALQQAAAAQSSAERAMSAGQPGQSMQPQQGSAAGLGRAAGALRRLGQRLSEQARRARQRPPEGEDALPGELAEAYDAARSASQSRQLSDAAMAARLMAQLAAGTIRRAMSMGVMPMAGWPNQSPEGMALSSNARVGAALPDLTAPQLAKLGITLEDWARLPGQLRDQVLQSARLGGPEEYRGLIKRYFQAIARLSAEKETSPQEPKKK